MSIDPKSMAQGYGANPYRRGSWGTTAYRPLEQPDYTYQDVYDPTQASGPYARPQARQVGRFDYEDGRAVGSTDFYGNRFDHRGLPLGPEQARAVQQLQGPGGPQAPEYQYGGGQQQYPGPSGQGWWEQTNPGQPTVSSGARMQPFGAPAGLSAAPGMPPPPGMAPGATGVGVRPGGYLSEQTVTRANALGYDPVVYQQFLDQGMDEASAERAAMTIGARQAVAGFSGYDPRNGMPTMQRQEWETKMLGEAYRGDQRYQQALAGAAQQRMQAQQAALTAEGSVQQRLFAQNLPVGRPANTADIANAQAAMRADPTYWQQINAARTYAQGGVTQGAQRATGSLDRQGPSFSQTLGQLYDGNQYRYGA